jgi:hypothetical protein
MATGFAETALFHQLYSPPARGRGDLFCFPLDAGEGGLDLLPKRVMSSRLAFTSACSASISATRLPGMALQATFYFRGLLPIRESCGEVGERAIGRARSPTSSRALGALQEQCGAP